MVVRKQLIVGLYVYLTFFTKKAEDLIEEYRKKRIRFEMPHIQRRKESKRIQLKLRVS